jgi:arylsulfatase A-like enzyme
MLFNVCVAQTRTATAKRPPNIIFILTDDMGYGDISCYNGVYKTPNIDRLASEGRIFTQYYSPSPICSPSRVGFLTGMTPAKWNITSFLQLKKDNRLCEQADYLSTDAPSVARILKSNGYATGHFGKWHMGGGRDVDDAPSIKAYGFDEYSSTWESPDPDPLITATDWIWSDKDSIKRWERTGYFVDKTLAFMARNKDRPCFVNLWPDDVHTPWVAGDEQAGRTTGGRESEASFKAVLKEYDHQIGRLMEGLKKLGLDNNTIIVFTSDNGPLPKFKGSRSAGLRGTKLSLYEGGIRLPFIVRWPAQVKPGAIDSTSVLWGIDLLPTFCKLAGVKMPPRVKPDGEDRSGVLLGKPAVRNRTLFWEYGRNDSSFRYPPQSNDRSPNLALREGKWKFLINADGNNPQLYDLDADPTESQNVVASHPQIAATLEKKLLAWRRSLPTLPSKVSAKDARP